jgi:hypothetical protein
VIYRRIPRLFPEVALAHGDSTYPTLLARFARVDVLILDGWGLVGLKNGPQALRNISRRKKNEDQTAATMTRLFQGGSQDSRPECRFAPIAIAGPRDHDGLDEVITMAGIRNKTEIEAARMNQHAFQGVPVTPQMRATHHL